jgi:hypothetical protein
LTIHLVYLRKQPSLQFKQRRLENLKPYDFKTKNLQTKFFYLRPESPDDEVLSLLPVEPDERLLLPELPDFTADLDWLPELPELTEDLD